MPITLFEAAETLLRQCLQGCRVDVTPETRETYRELARAGLMYPVSGFVHGAEANFRISEDAWRRRDEWLSAAAPSRPPESP
jgi:hypothetical protein